ncbi:MAG: pseudouridine synthase [Acidimicrobiia bacterium]
MAERIRIQKALSNAGLMSRRAAEMAISADRVRVNGRPVNLGDRVDVETDLLTVDDVPVPVNPDLETYLLYKPLGVVSTAQDTHGRPTVVDLVGSDTRLYPVGRLDADSEGLILVSNDGELTNRVTHPRYGITKRYVALVDGVPSDKQVRLLSMGIQLDDGVAAARSARLLGVAEGRGMVELVMTEGRNREVRRMMGAIGFTVTSLVRTAIGPISDRALRPGESRLLTPGEIQRLLGSGAS